MQNQRRIGNRVILTQGALAILAFTMMLGVAARGVQSLPDVQAQRTAAQDSDQYAVQADTKAGAKDVKTGVFTGTIVKDGEVLVFRDESGKLYRLSSQAKAKPFEGKPVKVKGQLEEATGLLHVDSIEKVAG
jgi:hypothetical protein